MSRRTPFPMVVHLHQHGKPSVDKALARVEQMLDEGAAIIDVGGESTRPGAEPVSLTEELDRVVPVVEAITQRFETIISVDTSSPDVMLAAAAAGAGTAERCARARAPGAIVAAAKTGLPVCLMHMQGQPKTMQQSPSYHSVVNEVSWYLQSRADACIAAGIDRSRLLIDPGFGFGKSVEHNLGLLNHLSVLADLDYPVLVGLSRKSLIGKKVLGRDVDQRLAGSLALAVLAAERGAAIIRVHDVAETVDAVRLGGNCPLNITINK